VTSNKFRVASYEFVERSRGVLSYALICKR